LLTILPCSCNAMKKLKSTSRGFKRFDSKVVDQVKKDRETKLKNLQKSKNGLSNPVALEDEPFQPSLQDLLNRPKQNLLDQPNKKKKNKESNKQDQTLNLKKSPLDRGNLSLGIQYQHARLQSILKKPKNLKNFSAKKDLQKSSDN